MHIAGAGGILLGKKVKGEITMEYGYYEQTGSPLRGRTLGELR